MNIPLLIALVIIGGVLAVVVAIFSWRVLLKFPLAAIIHCIQNPALSRKAKWRWMPLLIGGWTVGAIVYSFYGDKEKDLRVAGYLSIVWVGLFGIVAGAMMFSATKFTSDITSAAISSLDVSNTSEITAYERETFKEQLRQLNRETGFGSLLMRWRPEVYRTRMDLIGLAMRDIHDDFKLSRTELKAWTQWFEKRRNLTPQEREQLHHLVQEWRSSTRSKNTKSIK